MKYRFAILKEVYPNKGESKKDFISRFMSVTKDEYPDTKQRYAVANSYWNRRNKKRKSIDEYFEEPPIDYGTGDVANKDIFDKRTHTSFYDQLLTNPKYMAEKENLKGEIVMMSPEEYYKECAEKIFNVPIDKLKEERRYNKDNLDYLKKVVSKYKRKMFMPYINYAEGGQEGLHRMMVAGDLFGWDEKFPVLAITTYDEEKKRVIEKKKEERKIYELFREAVDRYRYAHENEEEFENNIRYYISNTISKWYDEDYFEYYNPLAFTMWYHTDDEEDEEFRHSYLTFVIADKGEEEIANDSWSFDIDAKDISFDGDNEEDDDVVGWDGFKLRLKDLDIDLDDPDLDIDAILKK